MNIYIDFDDVICETARHFTKIAKEMFGIDLPYQEVQFFNLKKTFGLDDEQYDEMMKAGHLPDALLAYEETQDASRIISKWAEAGHDIKIITGRPFSAYEPSRKWLDSHNLENIPLFCVDKYGREIFKEECTFSMTLEQLYSLSFDFAVEDSPAAFEHILHFKGCKTAVFDRPWNHNIVLPNDTFRRCANWQEIDRLFDACSE